jgi:hypothetical protein
MKRAARRVAATVVAALLAAAAGGQPRQGLRLPPADPNAPLPAAATRPAWSAPGQDLLALLRELKPLPKVHYSFPVPPAWLAASNQPLALEYVRITRSLSLSGESVTGPQVNVAVAICAAASRRDPRMPATLAINYSPWHRRFGEGLPPTDTGRTAQDEVDTFRDRLAAIRGWVEDASRRQGVTADVSALLLDSERFHVRAADEPGAAEWNAAIRAKHDAIYDVGKAVFPRARVIWYDFGGWGPSSSETGWSQSRYFDLGAKHDGWGVPLYRGPEIDTHREQFRRTVAAAEKFGVREAIPWIALGCGYKRQVEGAEWAWEFDWDYDLVYSWQLGREINVRWYGERPVRFAPWNAAPVACFYPGPYDPRAAAWPRHFIAYVRGATDVKKIDDIPPGAGRR